MPVHNADIAAVFGEIADLLEIQGANTFRIRAYRNAARTINDYARDLPGLINRGEAPPKLPGIGADLGAKLEEIARTGHSAFLDQLHEGWPAAITALLQIPGLGPKRVKILYDKLHVRTLEELDAAVRAGRVAGLPGFGPRTEANIRQAVAAHWSKARRFRLAFAEPYAQALAAYLEQAPSVRQVVVAGSFRRRQETVGDLDFVVAAASGPAVIKRFTAYDEVSEILSSGTTRASVRLRCGLQVDLRVVAIESYGATLHYFTGSKAHSIAVRRLAQARGLKINEYGVFRGKTRIAGATEESVYAAIDLPYIPPELREDRGEIAAARAGALPLLVLRRDLRGDLHSHTAASDGRDSLEDMARAAALQGLSYLAITDHSRHLSVAHGLDPRRLAQQGEAIDAWNAAHSEITLLKGIEVDILEDGGLDLPDAALKPLDLVVGAIHSRFGLSRAQQTERILRALDHPYLTLLAHPTGRLIGSREAYDVDMARIIRKARACGCHLELNAQPERLDLTDVHCRMARDEGVAVSIDSDAHSGADFRFLECGIGQARRGWLERRHVLNTRTLADLRPLLRQAQAAS